MQYRVLKNNCKLNIQLHLPASKSISNRLLIMSALSGGELVVEGLSDSDDTRIMQDLLGSREYIRNAGHAGTAMRFLTAYFSLAGNEVLLTGTERMQNRPIGELVNALRKMGADIEYASREGFPPLKIKGKALKGGRLSVNSGISSQFISALMMIGPCLDGGLEIELTGETISSSYLEITAGLMKRAGINIQTAPNLISIQPGIYAPGAYPTEPDWSAASYWFSVAGLYGDSEIFLGGFQEKSLQGDSALTGIYDGLGVKSSFLADGLKLSSEAVSKHHFQFDFTENPDIVQTLVPYCMAQGITFDFTGCRSLRIKETDRIAALRNETAKMGCTLGHSDDGDHIWWDGKEKAVFPQGITFNTYKDHRMAMAFAPLCIPAGEVIIDDPMVVTKSYPCFWDDFRKSGFEIEVVR